jgi:hypothetical protein
VKRGRANTVLVFEEGNCRKAVLSAILASRVRSDLARRIRFCGSVAFDDDVEGHINDTILPIIDDICGFLRIEPPSFELSAVNLSAASAIDARVCIEGFSADTAIFTAMLGACLNMTVLQDIVTTGHIASRDGDIAVVKAIPEKLDAAIQNSLVQFAYPKLDSDKSYELLSPIEKDRVFSALLDARDKLKLTPVSNIYELARVLFTDEAIVEASLLNGLFTFESPLQAGSPVGDCAQYIAAGNPKRFWDIVYAYLACGNSVKAVRLLTLWAKYFISQKMYPCGQGAKLHQIICAVPIQIRRAKIRFPLIETRLCIELAGFAGDGEQEDALLLLDATCGRNMPQTKSEVSDVGDSQQPGIFAVVISELTEKNLAEKFGIAIDSARSSFVMETSTVSSYDQFLETLVSFYTHLSRHIADNNGISPNSETTGPRALALANEALADRGGMDMAFVQARDGTRGGMRALLDEISEYFKDRTYRTHIHYVLTQTVDSLNWDDRVTFVRSAMDHLQAILPDDIKSQPPERFARDYETIVQAYVRAFDNVTNIMRKY